MTKRLRLFLKDHPALAGGLSVFAVVISLILLFIGGVVVAGLFFGSDTPAGLPAGDLATGGGAASVASVGTTSGSLGAEASVTAASTATATPSQRAESAAVAKDLELVSRPPTLTADTPDASAAYLDSNFGPALAPSEGAGLRLARAAVMSGEAVTAVYAGGPDGALDSLRLVVTRSPSSSAAAKETKAQLGEFGAGRLAYDHAGRRIEQGMTLEGRPEMYPPAVVLVWQQGRFVSQVTVIPVAPSRSAEARDAALRFVSTLRF